MFRILLAALVALAWPLLGVAAEPASPQKLNLESQQGRDQFLKGLTKRTGSIYLSSAKVTLKLGDHYYFLDPADSEKVLVDAWENPNDAADGVLGMVFPADQTPLDSAGWGAVVTYLDTGYVSDADARKTNYDDVLKQLRSGEDQDNEQRKKDGIPQIHLVGWAQPPAYDPGRHSLIWARQLHFGDEKDDTLNYGVRVLGRRGVLSLNVVAQMSQLPQMRTAADELRQVVVFDQGSSYADYQQGVDKKAAYGLAGLVLGGAGLAVAGKTGLLAAALLFLKKGIVLVFAGVAAAMAWVRRKFANRKSAS